MSANIKKKKLDKTEQILVFISLLKLNPQLRKISNLLTPVSDICWLWKYIRKIANMSTWSEWTIPN